MSHSAILWNAAHQASLSFTISWSLLKLMSLESVMPSNHHILYHPLLFLSSVFSSIRVFPNESLCIRWSKYWSFSIILPMNIQGWFPLGLTVSISLQSKNSQESSPTPQFKSLNSLVLSFLYSPTLISIELVISFNYLILCHPLLLLPSIFPSIRVFPMSQFF